jgi:hypothetical protein
MEEKDIERAVELLKAINEKIEEKDDEEKAKDLQADEPDAENKCKNACKNEEIDKRQEMGDVGGFLKSKGLSDEDIREVYKYMEKLSYDKSSKGTADNKKDEEKCAKNSMEDTLKEFYTEVKSKPSDYISEQKAREIGKQRY